MQVFKNYDDVLRAIIASYTYNYSDEYMVRVLEQVKHRINNGEWVQPLDEADIICSQLYYLYGDYGTSPRYGWFDIKELIPEFTKIIDEEIEELLENIKEDHKRVYTGEPNYNA